jgi:hypothetical protein
MEALMRRIIIAGLIGFALSGPVRADPAGDAFSAADDPLSAATEALLRGLIQEDDVALVFGYAREALSAAIEGRDAPVPEKLTRRAEAIGEEAKRRGAIAGRIVLDAIEQSVREIFREPRQSSSPLPPSTQRNAL